MTIDNFILSLFYPFTLLVKLIYPILATSYKSNSGEAKNVLSQYRLITITLEKLMYGFDFRHGVIFIKETVGAYLAQAFSDVHVFFLSYERLPYINWKEIGKKIKCNFIIACCCGWWFCVRMIFLFYGT